MHYPKVNYWSLQLSSPYSIFDSSGTEDEQYDGAGTGFSWGFNLSYPRFHDTQNPVCWWPRFTEYLVGGVDPPPSPDAKAR